MDAIREIACHSVPSKRPRFLHFAKQRDVSVLLFLFLYIDICCNVRFVVASGGILN